MSLSHSPLIVRDGLVLCLDAANPRSYPKSGTTWSDLAGSNNGTLTNGPTFDTGNGGSLVFDGSDDYVNLNIGHLATFIDPSWTTGNYHEFSLFGWAKTSISARRQVFGDWTTSGSDQTAAMEFGGYTKPTTSINVNVGGGAAYVTLLDPYELDTWYYIGVVKLSSQYFTGYLNAEYKGISAIGSQYTTQTQSSRLGTPGAVSTSNTFNGSISSFKIYNRALTAAEVLQNYNATRGRYGI